MSQDLNQLISGLHPLERKVLGALKKRPSYWDFELIRDTGLNESRVSMALGWLLAKDIIMVKEEKQTASISLSDVGKRYADIGLPEKRINDELMAGKRPTIKDLRERDDLDPSEVSTAIGNLKANQMIEIGEGGALKPFGGSFPPMVEGVLVKLLKRLAEKDEAENKANLSSEEYHLLSDFLEKKWKTRGVIKHHEKKSRHFILSPTGNELVGHLTPEMIAVEEVAQITPELLKEGGWKGKTFRQYNINLKPSRTAVGRKHAYRAFLDTVKYKLVSMGFEEMRGPLVEPEFWNSDALFMPQFHPARDIHDVYFVEKPDSVKNLPEPFASQVGRTHEKGWKTGSRGWRYPFDPERAKKLVLRSQGTAVSARKLAEAPKPPGKYFSIARCFRYDMVDATHAPDFFQVEGIAMGKGINFRTLLGLLRLFATGIARAKEVQYLPAYFPYTEPSVEMHVRHPKLGWMELGGAGLLRPEVTHPLGVKDPVIAWGLGLDRMAMVALGIQDIRDLFSSDLELIRSQRGGD